MHTKKTKRHRHKEVFDTDTYTTNTQKTYQNVKVAHKKTRTQKALVLYVCIIICMSNVFYVCVFWHRHERTRTQKALVLYVCILICKDTDTKGIMGWLRLVGSLKLQVSFAKEPYKRDDILQKRPIILRSLLIVATP